MFQQHAVELEKFDSITELKVEFIKQSKTELDSNHMNSKGSMKRGECKSLHSFPGFPTFESIFVYCSKSKILTKFYCHKRLHIHNQKTNTKFYIIAQWKQAGNVVQFIRQLKSKTVAFAIIFGCLQSEILK